MLKREIKNGTEWGAWYFDEKLMQLVLRRNGSDRHIFELRDRTDDSKVLSYIFQVRLKPWVTNEIIGDLVTALSDFHRADRRFQLDTEPLGQ